MANPARPKFALMAWERLAATSVTYSLIVNNPKHQYRHPVMRSCSICVAKIIIETEQLEQQLGPQFP